VRRWMRLLVAGGLIALLARLLRRVVLAGQRPRLQLWRLRPSTAPGVPQALPQALWASDPTLVAPVVTAVTTTDNAVILEWQDPNPTTENYIIFAGEPPAASAPESFFLRFPSSPRGGWFNESIGGPLRPGATFEIDIRAARTGISDQGGTAVATTSSPMIRIGDPATNSTFSPAADSAFAVWDFNEDGVVDNAQGSGGAYPLFPSSIGPDTVTRAGNKYDRIQDGPQANIIVGYFFVLQGEQRFVAFHLFIDPATNQPTPVSVSYGDAQPDVPGTRVWVSPGAQLSGLQVTEADLTRGSPNVVEGLVTAPTLASDGTIRIVEFTFRQALLQQ
jgi:hypothetical protein